jgi:hypothetical protein
VSLFSVDRADVVASRGVASATYYNQTFYATDEDALYRCIYTGSAYVWRLVSYPSQIPHHKENPSQPISKCAGSSAKAEWAAYCSPGKNHCNAMSPSKS